MPGAAASSRHSAGAAAPRRRASAPPAGAAVGRAARPAQQLRAGTTASGRGSRCRCVADVVDQGAPGRAGSPRRSRAARGRRPCSSRHLAHDVSKRERRGQAPPAAGPPGAAEARPRWLAQQVDQVAVLDHHALGPAGRAGGVDDVGGVVRRSGAHGASVVGRCRPVAACRSSATGTPASARRRRSAVSTSAAPRRRAGGRAGRPAGRVDRQVRRAGLEHGQQRHDQLGRARQRQRHHRAPGRRRAPISWSGQPVRPRVQLGDRSALASPQHQRGRVRRARRPAPRTARRTVAAGTSSGGVVPRRAAPRRARRSASSGSSASGRSGSAATPASSASRCPAIRSIVAGVEQVGVVLERAGQRAVALARTRR